jgi:hypothetical protein
VKTIGDFAFSSIDITSLELPEGVLSIGYRSFAACLKLEKIVLPSSLELIGVHVFNFCLSIKEIHCKAKNPPIVLADLVDTKFFDSAVLYVPKGYKEKYREKYAWKQFKNIVEE